MHPVLEAIYPWFAKEGVVVTQSAGSFCHRCRFDLGRANLQ